jgi:hypothetical protein
MEMIEIKNEAPNKDDLIFATEIETDFPKP